MAQAAYKEGVEIKIARIRAGLRQYEVAARVGILANRLSEIESGRRRPSAKVLQRLLQILGPVQSSQVTGKCEPKETIDEEKLSTQEKEL